MSWQLSKWVRQSYRAGTGMGIALGVSRLVPDSAVPALRQMLHVLSHKEKEMCIVLLFT